MMFFPFAILFCMILEISFVTSKSIVKFCYPDNCNTLKGTAHRPSFLAETCRNFTILTLDASFNSNLYYETFLNRAKEYAVTRRQLCDFEHRVLKTEAIPQIRPLYYGSYDLLAAGLMSHHMPFPSVKGSEDSVPTRFHWLEFGVAQGSSINITSLTLNYRLKENEINSKPLLKISGFDNFTGLPVSWGGYSQGSFTNHGIIPPVEKDVSLVVGLVEDSLPSFVKDHLNDRDSGFRNRIIGMNIDVDIYPTSLFILNSLFPYYPIRSNRRSEPKTPSSSGVLLHFHELFPTHNPFEELKALYDFALTHSVELDFLPYRSSSYEASLVKVHAINRVQRPHLVS